MHSSNNRKQNRTLFRAKVHRISVTECDVEYEGSLTLDTALMDAMRLWKLG